MDTAPPTRVSQYVRAIAYDDHEQLVDLHIAAFGNRDNSREQISHYYSQVLHHVLEDPRPGAPTNQSRCIVDNGRIVAIVIGCPVRVDYRGRSEWAVVGTLLSAWPGKVETANVGQMLVDFADGPQTMTMADRANERGRRAAARVEFRDYPQYSLRWGRVIHPGTGAAGALLNRKNLPRSLQRQALQIFAQSLNASAKRILASQLDVPSPRSRIQSRSLRVSDVVDHGSTLLDGYVLRPDFSDASSIEFQWNQLDVLRPEGTMHRVAVLDSRDALVGWYLLHEWPTGTAEVVQLICAPKMASDVIAQLLRHAHDLGVGSIHGDAPSSLLLPLANAGAHFYIRGSATVVHSRDPEVHETFAAGKAFITGLEGEYPVMLARAGSNDQ